MQLPGTEIVCTVFIRYVGILKQIIAPTNHLKVVKEEGALRLSGGATPRLARFMVSEIL